MKYASLQYIRGLAAVLVVYFHTSLQVQIATPGASVLPLFGSVGVDIFFVLSGFVMGISNRSNRTFSPLRFYGLRLRRIVPLYWLVTIVAVLTSSLVPEMARSVRLTTDHLLASLLFVPWPNPAFSAGNPNEMTPIIVPGWTLNYEMFFYLFFGLVLPFRPMMRIAILCGCFIGLFVANRLFNAEYPILDFYASGYLFEFLAGAMIAASISAMRQIPVQLATLALVLGAASLLLFDLEGVTLSQFITRGLPAVLVIAGAVYVERGRVLPEYPLLRLLGDASYSIYLVHGIALSLIRHLWIRADLSFTVLEQILFAVIGVVAGVAAGILLYTLVERPLLHVGRRRGLIGAGSA